MAFIASTSSSGSSNTPSVNVPSGAQAGDDVVLVCTRHATVENYASTKPSGFSTLNITSLTGEQIFVGRKKLSGADSGNYTFGTQPSTSWWVCQAFLFRGRHATDPIPSDGITVAESNTPGSSPLSITASGLTAEAGDDLLWLAAPDTTSSTTGTFSSPSGFTEREDVHADSWANLSGATKENVSAGNTGNAIGTFTAAGVSARYVAYLIRLKVAASSGSTSYSTDYDTSLVISKQVSSNIDYDTSLTIAKQITATVNYDTSLTVSKQIVSSVNYDTSLTVSKQITSSIDYDSLLIISKQVVHSIDYDTSLLVSKQLVNNIDYDTRLSISKQISLQTNYDTYLLISKEVSNYIDYDTLLNIVKVNYIDYDTVLLISKTINNSINYDTLLNVSKELTNYIDYDSSITVNKQFLNYIDYDSSITVNKQFLNYIDYDTVLTISKDYSEYIDYDISLLVSKALVYIKNYDTLLTIHNINENLYNFIRSRNIPIEKIKKIRGINIEAILNINR